MTSISPTAVPLSLVQEMREGVLQGTKHSWEATAFDGLFESHLKPSIRLATPAADVETQTGSARATVDEAASWKPDGKQTDDGPVAYGRSSPELPEVQVAAQGGSDVVEAGPAAASAPDHSGEEAQAADVSEASREAPHVEAPLPEQVVVSVVSDGTADIYVRDAALDGSADTLGHAIRELLDRHQLTLGRVKLNGHELGADGESGS